MATKNGAKKYHEGYDRLAYEAIAASGLEGNAIQSLGIDPTTFYRWIKNHESFKDAVERGKSFYLQATPDAQKLQLLQYIVETLANRGHVVTYRTKTITRFVRLNRRKEVLYSDEVETVTEHRELRPIQKWVADKVMPNASDLEAAILKVVNVGLRVSDPTLPVAGTSQGLTEPDYQAIDQIRENLLYGNQN